MVNAYQQIHLYLTMAQNTQIYIRQVINIDLVQI